MPRTRAVRRRALPGSRSWDLEPPAPETDCTLRDGTARPLDQTAGPHSSREAQRNHFDQSAPIATNRAQHPTTARRTRGERERRAPGPRHAQRGSSQATPAATRGARAPPARHRAPRVHVCSQSAHRSPRRAIALLDADAWKRAALSRRAPLSRAAGAVRCLYICCACAEPPVPSFYHTRAFVAPCVARTRVVLCVSCARVGV